jgi:hypothetical protein
MSAIRAIKAASGRGKMRQRLHLAIKAEYASDVRALGQVLANGSVPFRNALRQSLAL